MIKRIKRLFCKHKHTVHDHTDLVLQSDGSYKTEHHWKCRDCGKIIR